MSKTSAGPGANQDILRKFLARRRKIGIDTAVFIYEVEESPKYVELTQIIFDWLEGVRPPADARYREQQNGSSPHKDSAD